MGRKIGATIAGALVWAALWVTGTMGLAALMPGRLVPGQPASDTTALLVLIAYSVVLSLLAGFVAGRIARVMQPVWWLAFLQLALGIAIEASAWSMTPVWYHFVFLALLVPGTVLGGRLAVRA